MQPPLMAWFGGKSGLADWIVSLMPPHVSYLEPYAGSLAVLAAKPRADSETVNDLNGELVNLYRVCRDHGDELARRLDMTPYARREWMEAHAPATDPIERARQYVVHIEQAFAGDQRTSTWTLERVGSRRMKNWRSVGERVMGLMRRLDNVFIEEADALELIPKWADNPDCLIYLDPPYTTDVRGGTYSTDVTDDHHTALAEAVRDANAWVMLSGYDNPAYGDLFPGWHKDYRHTLVGGATGPRSDRVEVIWTNRVEETLFTHAGSPLAGNDPGWQTTTESNRDISTWPRRDPT